MDEASKLDRFLPMKHKPQYGNWIRMKVILLWCFVSVLLLGCGFVPWHTAFRIAMFCLSGLAIVTTLIVVYVYFAFSPNGGGYQKKIYDLVIDNLKFNGEGDCLDIGTGNGALAISIAKRYPRLICIGFDYWGKNWEYSRQTCEENAIIEGVNNRVLFRQSTASKLPFENEQFDVVISCLTFHEVKDTGNKNLLLEEALRVLKRGGKFSFLDLFFDKSYYGGISSLKRSLDSLGLENHTVKSIGEVINLPPILKYRRALGLAGVIFGTK